MNKEYVIYLSFVLISLSVSAQIEFEEGYYIDLDGNRVTALIRNEDWRDTPENFRYKLEGQESSNLAKPEDVLEFGINGKYRFVSREVQIDLSSRDPKQMNEIRAPQYATAHIFLQVILEGKAVLYQYRFNDLIKYFYSLDSQNPEQLIQRQYKVDGKIATNNFFRYQLFEYLKCPSKTLQTFEQLDYKKSDLKRVFTKYSECHNVEISEIVSHEERDVLNLTIRPGVRFSSLEATWGHQSPLNKYDYGSQVGRRIGLELELFIPHNKNKWTVTFEPSYQYFYAENTAVSHYESIYGVEKSIISYQSLEIPIGVRHYIYLNDQCKIFADAVAYVDVNFGSEIEFLDNEGEEIYQSKELSSGASYGLGAGLKYKDRYVIGARYQTYRNLFNDLASWYTGYKQLSVYVGYTFFRVKSH